MTKHLNTLIVFGALAVIAIYAMPHQLHPLPPKKAGESPPPSVEMSPPSAEESTAPLPTAEQSLPKPTEETPETPETSGPEISESPHAPIDEVSPPKDSMERENQASKSPEMPETPESNATPESTPESHDKPDEPTHEDGESEHNIETVHEEDAEKEKPPEESPTDVLYKSEAAAAEETEAIHADKNVNDAPVQHNETQSGAIGDHLLPPAQLNEELHNTPVEEAHTEPDQLLEPVPELPPPSPPVSSVESVHDTEAKPHDNVVPAPETDNETPKKHVKIVASE